MCGQILNSVRKIMMFAATILLSAGVASASTVDPILFNANTNTGGDDPAGLGTAFSATSSIPGDTVEDAFGNNDGGIESNTFIFDNGRTADNGNLVLGDGGESVDSISWSTTSVIILDGYRLLANPDNVGGGNFSRGVELAQFSVQGEADDLYDRDHQDGAIDRLFAIPQVGNAFQLSVTHFNDQGARINEIDALTTDTSAAVINTTIFNATTNNIGEGDQAPGLAYNFSSSPRVGADTIEDAFGNNNGNVEGATLLFADGGTVDNGDNVFGNAGETVDFVAWRTLSPVQLDGYVVSLEGDGGVQGAPRSTQLVRFFVNNVLVDTFDANGFTGAFSRLFSAGTQMGTDFRLELTRTTNGGANGGPRLVEIDALNAAAVPTPAALPAGLTLIALLTMRRRK
ncbi:MAG: hypothetical protein GC162_02435 [Planctomycetes bacterium]|nr:hypothetical protein [Planctomycetota bacterium]